MSRMNLEDSKLYDVYLEKGIKGRVHIQALAGPVTIDRDMGFLAFIDPNGATRIVTMPAAEAGLMFLITNTADAAEDLTINAPGAITKGTISQNEMAWVYSDGVTWYVGVGTTT